MQAGAAYLINSGRCLPAKRFDRKVQLTVYDENISDDMRNEICVMQKFLVEWSYSFARARNYAETIKYCTTLAR